jgi:pimeloyl-ACP methyl ester carboxylesterase
MRTLIRLGLLAVLIGFVSLAAAPARAHTTPAPSANVPPGCVQPDQSLPHGALWFYCLPLFGGEDLIIFAHGYVAFNEPIDFYHLEVGGANLSTIARSFGYAFATTSYRQNGLAVLEGVEDIGELIAAFKTVRTPRRIYLLGASEGGLIATLLAEQSPPRISGALAMCGPIGDFKRQVEYFGDFRVLFDYFYPGILPASPISIPNQLIADWQKGITSTYQLSVTNALNTHPISATQLISTTRAAIDPANRAATTVSTTLDVLWYNVFATNDATAKLGGNPYNNLSPRRTYTGSANDQLLNAGVQRFSASPTALANLAAYQTSGSPRVPLVTLHTTGDDVIPYWHANLYRAKVLPQWRFNLEQIRVQRYGHCQFTPAEALDAFNTLVQRVTTSRMYLPIVRRP